MKKVIIILCTIQLAIVVGAFMYSISVPLMRGNINPDIIGYGFIHNDAETNRYYVSIDSAKYFVTEVTSAVLPSFPVKYDIEDTKARVATVFTSDKFAGYQAMAGIEDDVKIIERAYKNPFLEVVSYSRAYYLAALFWPAFLVLMFILFTSHQRQGQILP